MQPPETSKGAFERIAPVLACVLIALAAVDLAVGLKGEPARLAVLIGGGILMLLLPRLQKFSVGKDGVSAELIHEAINTAKEASEKSKQLLIQGAGSAQVVQNAVARKESSSFSINHFVAQLPAPSDPADPQKGRFGSNKAAGWRVSGHVKNYNVDEGVLSFDVVLAGPKKTKDDQVFFVLHPSFTPSIYIATMRNGRASIFLRSWGAFTLGVVAEQGSVVLELDLSSELPDAPDVWRQR